MRTAFRPLHLLLLTEPFAHHLIHRGLHEPCGDGLTMTIPLAVIRDEVTIIHDIRAELFHRFAQWLEFGIRLFKAIVLHFALIQKWSRQRLAKEDISSPVTQSRQEVYDGYLLSDADVAPFPGFCPVLYGPQFCLLPGLCVGPYGGLGSQMHDLS